jgi:hypothetical protein
VQMQQAELQIKAAEQQRKVAKDQIDAQLRMQQQQIEAARITAQTQIQREKMETEKRMGALQTAAEMRDGKEREVMRIGAELAKAALKSSSPARHAKTKRIINGCTQCRRPTNGR